MKIGTRVIEHIVRIRIQQPTTCPERALFRTITIRWRAEDLARSSSVGLRRQQ
jgi:hypothetical protein